MIRATVAAFHYRDSSVLKSDHVNVRGGPNKDHDVAWIFTRSGLPVEITAEFENWRRIRDRDGAEGWVYHSLLSGKRTAYVTQPKTQTEFVSLRESADPSSPERAKLERGVIGTVKRCTGQWCRFSGDGFRRLDRAGPLVGSLSERKNRVIGAGAATRLHRIGDTPACNRPAIASLANAFWAAAAPRRRPG